MSTAFEKAAFANGARERLEFQFSGDDAALSDLLSNLVSGGIPVVHFSEDRQDLEEVFMQATEVWSHESHGRN